MINKDYSAVFRGIRLVFFKYFKNKMIRRNGTNVVNHLTDDVKTCDKTG